MGFPHRFAGRLGRAAVVAARHGGIGRYGPVGDAGGPVGTVPPPSPGSFSVEPVNNHPAPPGTPAPQPVASQIHVTRAEGTADLVDQPPVSGGPAMAAPGAVPVPPESMPAIQYTYSGQSVQPTFDPTLNAYVMPPVVARVPMYQNPDGSLVPAQDQVVVPVPAPLGTPAGATLQYLTPTGPGAPIQFAPGPINPNTMVYAQTQPMPVPYYGTGPQAAGQPNAQPMPEPTDSTGPNAAESASASASAPNAPAAVSPAQPSPFAPLVPVGTAPGAAGVPYGTVPVVTQAQPGQPPVGQVQGQVVGYLVPPQAVPPFGAGMNGPITSETLPPQPGATTFDQYCANCPAPVVATMTPYGAVGSAPDFRPELVKSSQIPLAITPADAWRFMNSGVPLIVLDVRSELERAVDGHIPGDANLSYDPKGTFILRAQRAIPDRDAPIIVYCNSGITSASAADMLSRGGFSRVFVLGAYANWPYARSK
ncbi:MAG: hypothetical protein LUG50_07220 [Planctomycetaceae bacterium]|nr:hypothetical protein [Planctomycetaceae bacterium]